MSDCTPTKERLPVISGSIKQLVSNMFIAISGYFTTMLIARYGGPTTFGMYFFVSSILVWIESITADGFGHLILTSSSKGDRETLARISLVQLLVACASSVVLIIVALAATNQPMALFLLFAALDIVPFSLFAREINILTANRRYTTRMYSTLLYATLKLLFMGGAIIIGLNPGSVFAGMALSSVISWLYTRSQLVEKISSLKSKVQINRQLLAQVFGSAAMVAGTTLLLSGDLWLLQWAKFAPAEIGYYAAALSVVKLMYFGTSALLPVLAPFCSSSRSIKPIISPEALPITLMLISGVLGCCILFTFFKKTVISIIFGPSFILASESLALLSLAYIFLLIGLTLWGCHFFAGNELRAGIYILIGGLAVPLFSTPAVMFSNISYAPIGPGMAGLALTLSAITFACSSKITSPAKGENL